MPKKSLLTLILLFLLLVGLTSVFIIGCGSGSGLGGKTDTDEPDWLTFVNLMRAKANLPAITENKNISYACWNHARYQLKNQDFNYDEDPKNAWYSKEGDEVAPKQLPILVGGVKSDEFIFASNFASGMFKLLLIDPYRYDLGYGSFRDAGQAGDFQTCGNFDYVDGLGSSVLPGISFPVKWPENGYEIPLMQYGSIPGYFENPDSLGKSGYAKPTGPHITLMLGPDAGTPNISFSFFGTPAGEKLDFTVYSETTYEGASESSTALGRSLLAKNHSIYVIPKAPLEGKKSYKVILTVSGVKYEWQFNVSDQAPPPGIEETRSSFDQMKTFMQVPNFPQ